MKNLKPKVAAAMVALIFIALFTYSAFASADEQTAWKPGAMACFGSLDYVAQHYDGQRRASAIRAWNGWTYAVEQWKPGEARELARAGLEIFEQGLKTGIVNEAQTLKVAHDCALAIQEYQP